MQQSQKGSLFALAAFMFWGFSPLYFKVVAHIPPLEILASRIVWSAVALVLLLFLLKQWGRVKVAFSDKRQVFYLLCATLLIGFNWGIFIWSIVSGQMLEASLGYYINPLVNIFLGFVVLGESMRPAQWIAVSLATIGVSIQIVSLGEIPWIGLSLALSFGFYGLLHKRIMVAEIPGLFVETLLLLPAALIFLVMLGIQQTGPLNWTITDWSLLILAGPVTIIPLLLFAAATKRITLIAIGFFQYISPSVLFVLALLFQEPFSLIKLITFVFIWMALAVISFDILKQQQRQRKLTGDLSNV